MFADQIVDGMQQFVHAFLDSHMVLPLQPSHIHPDEAVNQTVEHYKQKQNFKFLNKVFLIVEKQMRYLSTQCAAVIAQFSFNKAAPHLCKYVEVRHCRNDICQGHRPNDAFEPPTILGSGYIRLPQTAITINVELITIGDIIFLFVILFN